MIYFMLRGRHRDSRHIHSKAGPTIYLPSLLLCFGEAKGINGGAKPKPKKLESQKSRVCSSSPESVHLLFMNALTRRESHDDWQKDGS